MVEVNITVTEDNLVTLFSDADSGAAWWARIRYKFPAYVKGCCYEEKLVDFVMNHGGTFIIEDVEEETEYIIHKMTVVGALQLMSEKHPDDFFNLLSGNDDATTGDIFFQLLCFREVIYG